MRKPGRLNAANNHSVKTKKPNLRNSKTERSNGSFPVVVIGASAGGIEPLSRIVGELDCDFPGAVLVVLHTSRFSTLPLLLAQGSSLKVEHARDGQSIEPGQLLIAPPDQHMVISDGHIVLSRGPKQNSVRPAIDPLFKSAAASFGPRVIGVVLSGTLDDGSAGLVAVKREGGAGIVQEPNDAAYAEMPCNALAAAKADYVLKAEAIGQKLNKLVVVPMKKAKSKPQRMQSVEQGESDPKVIPSGKISSLTCPECGGTLWELHEGRVLRYVCHTGHAFSAESLHEEQGDGIERALWVALRALKERAMFVSRLKAEAGRNGRPHSQSRYLKEEADLKARAEVIQRVLLGESPGGESKSRGSRSTSSRSPKTGRE